MNDNSYPNDFPDSELLEVTIVARAVDDGVIYESETSWSDINEVSTSAHKLSDSIRRIEDSVSNRVDRFSESLRSNLDGVKQGVTAKASAVRAKVEHVTGEIKQGAVSADQKLKSNPYLFAAAAVGVGFLLGRIFLAQKTGKAKEELRHYPDYQRGGNLHTGVHFRDESRYAMR